MNVKTETVCLDESDSWGWGNEILYRMCREEPEHKRLDVIQGKVWLIGRSYSAAIERGAGEYKDIYSKRVAPKMKKSGIDTWLESVKAIDRVTAANVEDVLRVHKQLTDLFKRIAKTEKRSLASKYLHFHQPKAFFIFDSQANTKITELSKGQRFEVPKKFDSPYFDRSYVKFVHRCLWYRDNVFEKNLGRQSSPRELDRHLLGS